MKNALNWFEIPVTDFDRAKRFYEKVLGDQVHEETMGGIRMGFLPCDQGGTGGAICSGEQYKPSMDGTVVYLNGGEDLSAPLSRVAAAGGKVLMPKTLITPEIGHMAFFVDSEGNKVAFHSPK
jgi:predicted enzyme related to lactoylglutathione lyase